MAHKKLNSILLSAILCITIVFYKPINLEAGVTPNLKPRIFLEFSTRRTPLNINKSKIWLNGVDVSQNAEITQVDISYIPFHNLKAGNHKVKILLVDQKNEIRSKEWSFTIDPSAKTNDLKIDFMDPTPINGAIINSSDVICAIDTSGVNLKEATFETFLAEDGKGFRKINPESSESSNNKLLFLKKLIDGTKTLLVIFSDKDRNKKQLQTSFTIDTNKPKIESIIINSSLLPAEKIIIDTIFSDAPYHTVSKLLLEVYGPDGKNISLQAKTIYKKHQFEFLASKLKDWPAGLYNVKLTAWDYANHKANNQFPVYLQIYDRNSSLIKKYISLDTYPTSTSDYEINIEGKSNAQSQVVLFVNDQKFSTIKTGPLIFKGQFQFNKIPLEEGFNTIQFQLLTLDGGQISPKLNAPGILVDRTAPILLSRSPDNAERIISPNPDIEFSLFDPGQDIQDFSEKNKKGSGINDESVQCTIDGKKLNVFKSSGIFRAELLNDLNIGEHDLTISATDLLKNKMTFKSKFHIERGPMSTFDATIDKKVVYIHGGDFALITIHLKDAYGRPAADGSLMHLKSSKGSVAAHLTASNGIINARYIPPDSPGKSTITVYHPSIKRKIKFNIDNRELPTRIPHSLKIRQTKASLLADAGKSNITINATLYDAWDQPVSDGIAINLEASLGKLNDKQKITKKGEINFKLFSGSKVGDAFISLSHQQFKHTLRIPITEPPLGKTSSIEIQLKPKYLVAGSLLPQRITATLYDSFKRIVKDGTPVRFSVDKGRIVSSARTYKGKVINNFQAPEKAGIIILTVKSEGIEKTVPIEIVDNLQEMKVDKIWIKPFINNPIEGTIKIEGQLLGNRGQLIKGSKAVFIKSAQADNPNILIARDGTFSLTLKNCKPGKINIDLRSDEISKSFSFKCVKKVNNEIETSGNKETQKKLSAILDIDFQKTQISGTLNIGIVLIRVVLLKDSEMNLSDLTGRIIEIKSNAGKIALKAFLINGEARVPFSYDNQHKEDIILTAELNKNLKNQLIIHPDYQTIAVEEEIKFKANLFYKIQNKNLIITLTQAQGLVPNSIVTFTSKLNPLIKNKKVAWIGNNASLVYQIPLIGSAEIITAQCGDYNQTLNLNLDLIRPQIKQTFIANASSDDSKRELNIDTGLKLILLSGKTRLQTGGRDRTRLRFRLLDNKNNNIPDGTKVECYFSQGKINPFKTVVKRGLISINLQTSNWVGRYPFVVKVGNITKKINIDLVAPDLDSSSLPGFPKGPKNKSRRNR